MIGIAPQRRDRLDAPRRLVAVEPGQLDVHQDQIRALGLGAGHALLAGEGLEHLVAGARSAGRA